MKKQDLEKKKKIKELIFKIIHSITYVLSALFIVVCVAVGVQSCNSKNNTPNKVNRTLNDISLRAEMPFDFDYVYITQNQGTKTMPFEWCQKIATYYGYGGGKDSQGTLNYYVDDDFEGEYYLLQNGEYVRVYGWSIWFRLAQYIQNAFYCYYPNVKLKTSPNQAYYQAPITYFEKQSNDYQDGNNLTYVFSSDLQIITSDIDTNDYFLYSYFDKVTSAETISFTFNNQINYNAPIGGTLEQPFINRSGGDYQYTYDFWFYSGGQLFNQIKVFYFDAHGATFLLSDNTKYTYSGGLNTAVYYSMMYYVNTLTNTMVLVNSRNMSAYTSGSALSYYQENTSTWSSQYYRNITILIPNDDIILNVSRFNNNSGTASSIGYTNIGLGNVFTLLSDAFLSIFPLISIQIIPGLTIGLLLFLPLVVSIIVLVFKAVKK